MKTIFYKILYKNKDVVYVGVTTRTITQRFREHLISKSLNVKDYSIVGFDSIEHLDINSLEAYYTEYNKVIKLEQKYIKEELDKGSHLLNISKGGEWGARILSQLKREEFLKIHGSYNEYNKHRDKTRKVLKLISYWVRTGTLNKTKGLIRNWVQCRSYNKTKRLISHWVQNKNKAKELISHWIWINTLNKTKRLISIWVQCRSYNKTKRLISHWVQNKNKNKTKGLIRNWVQCRSYNKTKRLISHWVQGRSYNKTKRLINSWRFIKTSNKTKR